MDIRYGLVLIIINCNVYAATEVFFTETHYFLYKSFIIYRVSRYSNFAIKYIV